MGFFRKLFGSSRNEGLWDPEDLMLWRQYRTDALVAIAKPITGKKINIKYQAFSKINPSFQLEGPKQAATVLMCAINDIGAQVVDENGEPDAYVDLMRSSSGRAIFHILDKEKVEYFCKETHEDYLISEIIGNLAKFFKTTIP